MTYVLFAQWFGIVSTVLALGILFHLNDARKMASEMIEGATGYIMGGVFPLLLGSFLFVHAGSWSVGWPKVVHFVGGFMLLVGLFRVWAVGTWRGLLRAHADTIPVLFSLFGLILGLLLLYIGFVSHHL
jgi:hypothetical protein